MLVIVSGPSGVGKSRLIALACSQFGFARSVPITTRSKRPGEVEGLDYEFVSKSRFRSLIIEGQLCMWDFTLRHYYGYRVDLRRRCSSGEAIVIHALARMGLRFFQDNSDVFLVFLDSPSDALLDHRLADRAYDETELLLRRQHWAEEREHSSMFHLVLRDGDRAPDRDLTLALADLLTRFA
jgi:guanylate kinase